MGRPSPRGQNFTGGVICFGMIHVLKVVDLQVRKLLRSELVESAGPGRLVAYCRLGMVGDPTDPETWTPPVQYYLYDLVLAARTGVTNRARCMVRFNDQLMEVCAGYLTGGRPDHVVTFGRSAERLLHSKMQNPIAAALGGYALLKLNDLDRIHD